MIGTFPPSYPPSPASQHLLITLNSSYLTRGEETKLSSLPPPPDTAPVPGWRRLSPLPSFLSSAPVSSPDPSSLLSGRLPVRTSQLGRGLSEVRWSNNNLGGLWEKYQVISWGYWHGSSLTQHHTFREPGSQLKTNPIRGRKTFSKTIFLEKNKI